MLSKTRPAAPETSTQYDDDYVYIRVPREMMAPVNDGFSETLEYLASQSAGPQNATPSNHSVTVQPAAHVSQQWRGDSIAIYSARSSVVKLGGCGVSSVDSVENEPHLKALAQHLRGGLAPGASGAAEVKVLMAYGADITAMSEELAETFWGHPMTPPTALMQACVAYARGGDVLGPSV